MKSIAYEFVYILNYWFACLFFFSLVILVWDDTCEMNKEGKCFSYVSLHNKPLQNLVAENHSNLLLILWVE